MQEIDFENNKKDFMKDFMNSNRRNKLLIISLVSVGLGILFVFLLYKYLAPFGKVVSYTFASKLPGAKDATTFPASKDNSLTIPSQIIGTAQARFTVNLLTPNISSIRARLRFKKNTREIRFGVRGNETDSFIYHPLYYSLLQDLDWTQLNESDFTLWQKEKIFTNLYDFVNNVSLEKKTAVYFVDVDKLSLLTPKEASGYAPTVILSQLRGTHTLLVRVDKAPLTVKVVKQDLNAYEGEDKVKIVVSKDGKTIAEQTIPDDEIATISNLMMQSQETTLIVRDIKQGLYQLDVISEGKGSDSLITKIEINQQKVVLKNYFYALGSKPSMFWTDANIVTITTWHNQGLQTVKLNGDIDLKITEINKKYTFNLEELSGEKSSSALFQLEFPKNDLVVNYEGYIVFNKENYFEPDIIKLVPLTTLDSLSSVDYILTSYQKAKQDGDWLVAETTFDPKDIKIAGNKLYFSLEMPDISKYGGELEIESLEIEAKSDGILSKIEQKKKDTVKPSSPAVQKQNIFSRFFDWIKKIFSFKKAAKPTPTPTPSVRVIPTPISPIATSSATPTTTAKIDLLVRVLNGGGEKGSAASIAAILKAGNFTNVIADNADRYDYKGATIQYRKGDESIVDKIESLIKKEYVTITKVPVSTTASEILLIVGKK